MSFSDEGRNHTDDQQEQEPGRKHHDRDRQGDRRNHLLDEASNRLDHVQPVGGLNPGSLQAVIKRRIFVGHQIQAGGVLHDANADVVHVPAREQGIEVVDDAAEYAGR